MLSVVIPAKDEAENLPDLIREVHEALEGVEHEVVVVDDGSTDATPEVLARLRAEDERLRVLRHRVSCGQSAGLRTGIKAARYPWIATLDGDGQNDPADLPKLLAARPEGATPDRPWLAIGHRVDRHDSAWRRFSSRFAFGMRRLWLGDDTPDTGCGIKVFGRAMFLDLPWFDHVHRFLPALVRRAGGETVSVPVRHRPRLHGRSKYGTLGRAWVGLVDLFGVRWLIARNRNPEVEER